MELYSDFWVVRPFNAVFLLCAAFFLGLLAAASLLLRRKSLRVRQEVLIGACLLTVAGFFVYKYFNSIDAEYHIIQQKMGGFSWWGELPLHLCNVNMILIPVAVLRRSRPLMAFCFFLGPLGALMALAMPGNGFGGYPLFLPRMIGYYGTHFMVIIEGLALVSFGLYRPRFDDLLPTVFTALAVTFIIFLIDVFLRRTGIYPRANYFYAMETEDNFVLDLFHRWIPLPFLYLMPCVVILGIYMTAVTGVFALFGRKAENGRQDG